MKNIILITGGCGFIGTNAAAHYLKRGYKVIIFDNLSRAGGKANLKWLKSRGGNFIFVKGDIRDDKKLLETFGKYKPDLVLHLAAQSIPENVYVPIQSTPTVGTRTMTFGKLWEQQSKINKPQRAKKGEIIFLRGKQVKALSFLNGGQWMPIRAIYRHRYGGKIIKLNQKWGIIEATPNHSIYSANLELSNPKENPELLAIRNVNLFRRKKKKVNKRLLEILAAYITEGCATITKKNDYHIEISQNNKKWLENIQTAVEKVFSIKGWVFLRNKIKNHWVFVFSNKNFFNYLIKNCGKYSYRKFFPDWIFDLSPEYQEFFWQKLLEGDGTKDGEYKTTSYKLANQISLLLALLGKKFTVYEFNPKNKKWRTSWGFKTSKDFDLGLNQRRQKMINYNGWVYDLEINPTHNFVCGIGNIVCHNTTMVTSITNPREDFEINALGTFNLLEAMRKTKSKASAIFSSTNKVLGDLSYIPTIEKEKRYEYNKYIKGVDENFPLNFYGPYGCSKGAADQYFLDYARIFGLNTIVFRQSTIYGPRQFGIEEQGWIAWFCNCLIFGKPVTIYGSGKQVRDVLYIDDLISAFDLAAMNIKKTRGKAYNIGGGPEFSLSILELIEILEKIKNEKLNYKFGPWRSGDQKIYISDISRAKNDFGFQPKISPKEGTKRLYNWISENKTPIKKSGVFKR